MSNLIISNMIEASNKRYEAMKNASHCPRCLSQQIQLISWLVTTSWKCRHCKHEFGEKLK